MVLTGSGEALTSGHLHSESGPQVLQGCGGELLEVGEEGRGGEGGGWKGSEQHIRIS